MSIVTNTYETYGAKGIREDLADIIYNISPTDTPFMSNIGRGVAKQTLHEWQTDALAAAISTNAVVEGDDVATFPSVAATTRVGNYTQISRKLIILSDTLEVVDKAGRKSELAYQLAKRSSELKRDMETTILTAQGGDGGGAATARTLASMNAWLKTNIDMATDGTSPSWTSGVPPVPRTDGTQRAFTETIFKSVVQQIWVSGGDLKMCMVGPFNKTVVSGFQGIATKTYYQSAAKASAIIGAADVYVSDFGTLSIVPNRFQRERDAWFIDPAYAGLAFLRNFRTVVLAKTGDAEKRMLLVEYTLKVNNEAAHGLAADLTTS